MTFIYFNKEILSSSSAIFTADDRGLLLGDGLFETMRAHRGRVVFFEQHWERLSLGSKQLKISLPLSMKEAKEAVSLILDANQLSKSNASLRLTVTRGRGPRGLLPPKTIYPNILLTASPFSPPPCMGISACISTIRKNSSSPLSNMKTLNYLDNVLALNEAREKGKDEALLLNFQENIAESSKANFFLVKKHALYTPPLKDGALPGIVRNSLAFLGKKLSLPYFEKSLSLEDLFNAEEAFLTNSLNGITPLTQVENSLIGNGRIGKITELLQKSYQQHIDHLISSNTKIASNLP